MLEGFYTAASGMMMQQRTLNTITNNITNVRTPGFRAERVVATTFEHELLTRMEAGDTGVVGAGTPIRIVDDVFTIADASLLEETGRPFDIAINGEGYFNIQGTEEGQTFLTRNGHFDVDEEGFLVLKGAGRVLGEDGEIEVGGSNFAVNEDGEVYDERNRLIDRLLITVPGQDVQLEKFTNGLYTVADGGEMVPAENMTVRQGILERSNVDMNREYTLAMEAQRAFQSCSQAIKIVDQMNQKSVTQIASL
ncbi:flagellar hook-basal body protein [Marasmitruncus massiliensis]|jgi:flagellar basal body rod protein FlgG|uniref:flagellar hook-basal body protein n=1 Tax=Marasmitruncus massiliensis TaxID=1944642 RepID=UPI000C7C0C5F|nr:flagellar hook-basal body protein [Marasmitruncus massiliensis]MBE6906547.1 flagellar hook-basal body protein [Oscillospiraceae bacterium]